MKSHFAPCESCGRHIRVSEDACPFCDGVTSSAFRAQRAPAAPNKRLSRAALFMFGAASATAGAGCSSSASVTPVYGAPADTGILETSSDGGVDASDGGVDSAKADTLDTGGPTPAYGLPPDTGTVDTSPAADTADGGAAPAYGLPPDAG